jgi:hypothetical protein
VIISFWEKFNEGIIMRQPPYVPLASKEMVMRRYKNVYVKSRESLAKGEGAGLLLPV